MYMSFMSLHGYALTFPLHSVYRVWWNFTPITQVSTLPPADIECMLENKLRQPDGNPGKVHLKETPSKSVFLQAGNQAL